MDVHRGILSCEFSGDGTTTRLVKFDSGYTSEQKSALDAQSSRRFHFPRRVSVDHHLVCNHRLTAPNCRNQNLRCVRCCQFLHPRPEVRNHKRHQHQHHHAQRATQNGDWRKDPSISHTTRRHGNHFIVSSKSVHDQCCSKACRKWHGKLQHWHHGQGHILKDGVGADGIVCQRLGCSTKGDDGHDHRCSDCKHAQQFPDNMAPQCPRNSGEANFAIRRVLCCGFQRLIHGHGGAVPQSAETVLLQLAVQRALTNAKHLRSLLTISSSHCQRLPNCFLL